MGSVIVNGGGVSIGRGIKVTCLGCGTDMALAPGVISVTCSNCGRSANVKFPTPPPAKVVIPDRNGLIRQDDNVCVCGHWGAVHRNGGKATCEGRDCGCYKFRPPIRSEMAAVGRLGPKCPTCDELLLGKLLRVVSPTTFQTVYRHLFNDNVCMVDDILPEVAEREKDVERQRERDSEWDDGSVGWEEPLEWGQGRGPQGEPLPKPAPKPEPALEPEPLIGRARIALEEEV